MGYKANMYLDYEIMHDKVTGSCILCKLRLPNKIISFLVDCGLYQEKEYIYKNNMLNLDPTELSYVFLTHIHTDHCGRIPMLYKNGYKNKVLTTHITKELLPVSLNNTLQILKTEAKKIPPLFNEEDLEKTYKNVCNYDYNKMIKLNENISIMFLENGHIFGATSIFMKFSYPNEKDINVLFTGDYAPSNTFFDITKIPAEILSKEVTIIQESTYGNIDTSKIVLTLKNNIKNAVKQNKTILLPAFAIGRYQETEYLVRKWQKEGVIPKRYTIYLDGNMPHDYNDILKKFTKTFKPNCRNYTPEKSFRVVSQIRDSNKKKSKKSNKKNKRKKELQLALREKVISSKKPKIVITTSGMGSNGPANEYITNWICRKDVVIHFLGYVAEGTTGHYLQNYKNSDTTIEADIYFTNEMSSHAKQDELLDFINKFIKVNCVLINHGNEQAKKEYKIACEKYTHAKNVLILETNNIYRIGAYGFIKSFKKNS